MLPPWPRRVAVPLLVSAVLVVVGLVVRLAGLHLLEPDDPAPLALRLLDVNRERNVPTAWSVGLLLTCAWTAGRLARAQVQGCRLLVAALVAMALDEGVQVHERADALGRVLAGESLHFAWVVPGLLVSGVVGLVLLRSLRGVSRLLRRRLGLAAALYLTGALLVETVSGTVLDTLGRGVVYALLNALEEGLEMTATCLLLGALLLALPQPDAPDAPAPDGSAALPAHA